MMNPFPFTITIIGTCILYISTNNGVKAQQCNSPELSNCECENQAVNCFASGLTAVPELPSDTLQCLLSDNSITTLPDNAFAEAYDLQFLYIKSNDIGTVSPNAFQGLTSLHTLYLDNNLIVSLPATVFSTNVKLITLSLTYNLIESLPADLLDNTLVSTSTFFLYNNPIKCCLMTTYINWLLDDPPTHNQEDVYVLPCTDFGRTTDYKTFNVSNCSKPVDGQWSEWENSTCSVTCGTGIVRRNRSCDNPPPSDGGKNCTGSDTDMVECSLGNCPECPPQEIQESILELCMKVLHIHHVYGNTSERNNDRRSGNIRNQKRYHGKDKRRRGNQKNKKISKRSRHGRYHVIDKRSFYSFDRSSKDLECECAEGDRYLQLSYSLIAACTDIVDNF